MTISTGQTEPAATINETALETPMPLYAVDMDCCVLVIADNLRQAEEIALGQIASPLRSDFRVSSGLIEKTADLDDLGIELTLERRLVGSDPGDTRTIGDHLAAGAAPGGEA